MEKQAKQWLAARNVIADFLKGHGPLWTQEALERAAAALLARLAHNGLLICTADELKD